MAKMMTGREWVRPPSLLLVEDEPSVRVAIAAALEAAGFVVFEAATLASAFERLGSARLDAIVTDLRLPDGDALDLLRRVRASDATIPVYIVTGHGTIDLAVRAVKSGADDFLTKPVDIDLLTDVIGRAVERSAPRPSQRRPLDTFVSRSLAMHRIEDQITRLRDADCPVLLLGETGTGKSVLARRIHAVGARAKGAFVDINCAGLSRELVESELFGHERGAFTGALVAKQGLLDSANGGSLFLDEIGDLDPQVQPKLLKVLEEKRFRRMGDVRERVVDVRLVGATHHDLLEAVARKAFRADLYYRISTVTITLPALRDRPDDIVPLAEHMLAGMGRDDVAIATDAKIALLDHPWPGNLRELRNVLERAILGCASGIIHREDLRFDAPSAPELPRPVALRASGEVPVGRPREEEALSDVERAHIRRILAEEGGRVTAAALRLGIPRSTLYQRMKEYGIRPSRTRGALRDPAAGEED